MIMESQDGRGISVIKSFMGVATLLSLLIWFTVYPI